MVAVTPLRRGVAAGLVALVLIVGASCGGAKPRPSASVGTTGSKAPGPLTPLTAPKTSTVQDTEYLADVAQADSTLANYVQAQGNVGLQALLTDGTAFCAFLQRGGGIDDAMTALVDGARGVESQTSLPMTVTTFNTIDAVALLVLCPSEQSLLPAADRARISQLGQQLGIQPG